MCARSVVSACFKWILESVQTSFARKIMFACVFGLIFGVGWLWGHLKQPLRNVKQTTGLDALEQKSERYGQLAEQLNLTFYHALQEPPPQVVVAPSESAPIENAEKPVEELEKITERDLHEKAENPKAPSPQSRERLAQALSKVLGKDAPSAVKETAKKALPIGTGSPYAVQVASFPDRDAAQSMVERLQKKGYPVQIVRGEVSGRGVFRVRLHGFSSRQDAENMRRQIEEREHLSAIIIAQ